MAVGIVLCLEAGYVTNEGIEVEIRYNAVLYTNGIDVDSIVTSRSQPVITTPKKEIR